MTKRLILIRHAKSSWDMPGPDYDRPLNKRGYKSAKAVGDWLRTQGYLPDQILCSTAKRTFETYEGLALTAEIQFLKSLYHASPDQMIHDLRTTTGEVVALIGHNPGMALFANQLVSELPVHPRFVDYPTCATAVIEFDIDRWQEINPKTGQLLDFIIPRELV
jgi:phosphohistidine phosphatase